MKSIIVDTYKDEDEIEVNKLFNIVFKKHRDLKEWHWKYKECPIDSRPFVVLAKDKDKIIGQYPSIAYFLRYQNRLIKMAQPVDIVVHEDYRGGIKGVLVEMFLKEEEKWRENGIDIAFGFPTREHYIVGKRILHYLDLIKIENFFKRLSWRLSLRNRFNVPIVYDFGGWISRVLIRFLLAKNIKVIKGVRYRWVETFDERVNSFWERIKQQYVIWVVRDLSYLDWRYCRKPANDYHILQAERNGDIIGIIILKYKDHENVRTGFIMESLAVKEPYLKENLVRKGLIFLSKMKVDQVFVRLSSSDPLKEMFKQLGFVPGDCELGSNFVYKTYSSRVEDSALRDATMWHISIGDCDSL